jgi:hypothetical protein
MEVEWSQQARTTTSPKVLEQRLCQTLKDSSIAFELKLRGGLPTGREALQPSEPHQSLDKAMLSYYTKNETFASGISKMWCVL